MRSSRNTFAKNEYPKIYFSVKNTKSSRVVAYQPKNLQRLVSIASRPSRNALFTFRVEYGKTVDVIGNKISFDNEIQTGSIDSLKWAWKTFLDNSLLKEWTSEGKRKIINFDPKLIGSPTREPQY